MARYKLKLTKLSFLSSVDAPAQGDGAKALLFKRDEVRITARVTKMSDDLGLVFGHAFAASLDGGATPHVDVQNDAIDPDFLKTAMEFMEAGGATDVNHDFEADGRIVFAWPLIPEVNDALGIKSDVIGLAVAVKPSAETYAKFKSGELTGFSIAGMGEREPLSDEESKKSDESTADAQAKSTRMAAVHQRVFNMTLEDATAEIETLKAKLAKAERLASQTDAERHAEIEKSDPVAYRGEVSGITVRKSEATDFAMKLAMAHEAQAVTIAKQKADVAKANEAAEIEKSKREATELRKRAEPMFKGLAGADAVHDTILAAVEATKNEDALTALKAMTDGARKALSDLSVAKGINPGEDATEKSAPTEYEELVVKTMTDEQCDRPTAADKVLKTKRGQELYAAISKSTKTNK